MNFIRRNQKKASVKDNNSESTRNEGDKVMDERMQKLYEKINQIHTEQLRLETMVAELERKNEQINTSTKEIMSGFYTKYFVILTS